MTVEWSVPTYRTGPLTPENLTHHAPQLKGMVTVDANGARPLTPEEIAGMVLGRGPQGLPDLVAAQLLRARECMAYGGYHYPFITIGLGQLGLTAEAAIRAYAEHHGLTTHTGRAPKGMVPLIEELRGAGHLSTGQEEYWKGVAKLRNHLAHPAEVAVYPADAILFHLNTLTLALLQLFPDARFDTGSREP